MHLMTTAALTIEYLMFCHREFHLWQIKHLTAKARISANQNISATTALSLWEVSFDIVYFGLIEQRTLMAFVARLGTTTLGRRFPFGALGPLSGGAG